MSASISDHREVRETRAREASKNFCLQ